MTTPSLLSGLLTHSVSNARAAGASNAWLDGGSEEGPAGATFLRALNEARQAATALAEPPRPALPEAALAPGRVVAREAVREAVREPVREAAREPVREPAREPVRETARSPERPGTARDRASSETRRAEDSDERAAERHREASPTQDAARTPPTDARRSAASARRAAGANGSSASTTEAAEEAADGESTPVRGRKAAGRARQGAGEVDLAGAERTAAVGLDSPPATPGAASGDSDTGARTGPADANDAARGQPGWRAPIDITADRSTSRVAAAGRRAGLSGADGASGESSADATTPLARSDGRAASSGRAGDSATGAIDLQALGLRATQGDTAASGLATEGLGDTGAGVAAGAPVGASPGLAPGGPPGALGSLLGAAGAAGLTGAGAAAEPSSVRDAGLAAPPGSEPFARELGAQVTLFVREGVQQARLHLNPQDLGPVLVQIQLDGQAAHVQFSAEMQPTRDALQQALPTLAGQLSEAGLTLAGGGVFERPPQEPGGRRADEAGGRADGPAAEPGATPLPGHDPRWSRPRGLVDLMA